MLEPLCYLSKGTGQDGVGLKHYTIRLYQMVRDGGFVCVVVLDG